MTQLPNNESIHLQIRLRGRVQGVGFRPFVYRLATELGLVGTVCNSGDGVTIGIQGSRGQTDRFLSELERRLPPVASIDARTVEQKPPADYIGFVIEGSEPGSAASATVIPDLATCPACLAEINDPANRRYRYPFTNCTLCGPRYSIIEAVPYDRPRTTMKRFTMCPACQAEYDDPSDRRFHAQPNACPVCGPRLELWDVKGRVVGRDDQALRDACAAIRDGRTVALKGLGGFQLLVDARSDIAVHRLRERKHRPTKPFALMYPNIETVRNDFGPAACEEAALLSPQSPIVLLGRGTMTGFALADGVAPRNPYHGVMLPYSPLHHLILQELAFPIVATSGNLSEEPICIDEDEALRSLEGIADLFLVHNRPIARPLDDSVVQRIESDLVLIRAARGYAPLTFPLATSTRPLLATGPHLKNTIAFASGAQVVVSQHIGDLSGPKAHATMEASIESAAALYAVSFRRAVCDLHPDYHSTRVAHRFDPDPASVQHHHAHVLSCMFEHGLKGPVIGVAWDGTGLGSDGTIWGGEFLAVNDRGFERVGFLRPFPLPGGDRAITEPRRSALGLLYEIRGAGLKELTSLPPVREYTETELNLLLRMIGGGLNTFVTTSAGRLFDGLASLLGLSQVTSFEGEAAMLLQFAAEAHGPAEPYDLNLIREGGAVIVDWEPMVREVIEDLGRKSDGGLIAARCHATMVDMIAATVRTTGGNRVVLSGGCFQNRLLLEATIKRLRADGKEVYYQRRVPTNDGGVSLGQAAFAIGQPGNER